MLLGRTLATLEKVAAEIGPRAMPIACDVGSADSVRTAFTAIAKRHPTFHVLINNAGVYEPFMIEEARDDQILTSLSTNLAGPVFCIRAAIPMLPRGGHIINVSSESVAEPFFMHSLYRSTKAGLEKFSEAMSRELQPKGIRVSVVRAGAMMDEDSVLNLDPEVQEAFRGRQHGRGHQLSRATHLAVRVGHECLPRTDRSAAGRTGRFCKPACPRRGPLIASPNFQEPP